MQTSIDTFYNKNYYRSRLEARWAYFFDLCEIPYLYEPEGFNLSNGQKYLPDFYIPLFDCYIEIKPDDCNAYKKNGFVKYEALISHKDFNKWASFSKEKNLIVIFGNPHNKSNFMLHNDFRSHSDFEPNIANVGFYNNYREWVLWICGGDEEFDELDKNIQLAIMKRFEHISI